VVVLGEDLQSCEHLDLVVGAFISPPLCQLVVNYIHTVQSGAYVRMLSNKGIMCYENEGASTEYLLAV
jgi:hypothetical protein